MDEMTSSFRALYRKAASAVTDLSSDAGTNRIPDKAQHLGDWIRSWGSDEEPLSARSVRVLVQPGWAVKKYHGQQSRIPADASPFDLIVNITGIGVVDRELSAVSRTQRALILVAKRFASLPRMPIVEGTTSLPPLADSGSSRGILSSELAFKDLTKLKHAHSNLDSRLQPFWSSSAPEQVLGLRIKTRTNGAGHGSVSSADSANILVDTTVTTDSQGHFVKSLVIPWTKLCTDPASVPYIFKQHSGTASTHDVQNWELDIQIKAVDSLMEDEPSLIDEPPASAPSSTEATYYMHVAETAGIRVISDLDDTIKHSDILAGPREVFRNVFCRPLEDVAVPGMNSLYQKLATCGVSGFHYVSNSPLELLSTINDFLRLHAFPPPVSLRLKLYGGRSLVASLFDSPGDRKRQVVNNIFDSFPDSKFILIGDSGEQDLELYASLAIDHPRRVLAVIIRDVTSCRALELRQLPLTARRTPSRQSSASSVQSFESIRGSGLGNPVNSRGQDGQDADSFSTALHEMQDLTSAQEKILKRAAHWDERVLLAQHTIPGHIPLIFFEHTFEMEDQIVQLARAGLNIT